MARFRAFASDSEEESENSESSSSRSAQQPASKPVNGRPVQPNYGASSSSSSTSEESAEDDSYGTDDEEESNSGEEDDDMADGEEADEAESTPWPKQLNLEPHKVNVMQSSLFRIPELVKTQQNGSFSFLKHQIPPDPFVEKKAAHARASFAQPRSQPPPRKYARVGLSESVCAMHEDLYLDAGLSMSRSFRVGWGLGNKLVHVGGFSKSDSPSQSSESSVINISKFKIEPPKSPEILSHLLSYCSVITSPSDENGFTPCASPKSGICFSTFSSLFTAQDRSHCASVFRLGHALFDPLNLHLKDDVPADIRNRVFALRRADALSSWISRAVSSTVEQEIKAVASDDSARQAFLYLSGNQVEKAVEILTSKGNVRIATIVSQIPGDAEFRADIREQIQIWKDEKVDTFMDESIRKLYALAAGEVDILEGSSRKESIDITKGLDWLRVLGLQLWYSTSLDSPLHETFEVYEQLIEAANGRVGYPTPWYSESSPMETSAKDGLFNLIKLSLSPTMTLESALDPLGFSPNPRDFRLPWFLYILLSRCLRIRDFTDRQLYDAMDEDSSATTQEIEGYSQVANALTTNFAAQLQEEGAIQEAAYVLLFLEDDVCRKLAIKDLLSRSAPLLEPFMISGLCGSLRIPMEWIDEAMAIHAFYSGDVYLAYELYTRAKSHRRAHELALTYLAPEAVLRDELDVLARLFTVLDENLIDDFGVGGQLFIDYARIVSRVPELREVQAREDSVPDAAEVSELETLSARIPKLIAVLPDVLHDKPGTDDQCRAALSHMLSKLLDCVDPSVPMKVEIPTGLVDEGARIKHIHASAYGSFMRTIEELA